MILSHNKTKCHQPKLLKVYMWLTFSILSMLIRRCDVTHAEFKTCNFITLWELIKRPQKSVQGSFFIKSLKVCHKNRGEFLASILLLSENILAFFTVYFNNSITTKGNYFYLNSDTHWHRVTNLLFSSKYTFCKELIIWPLPPNCSANTGKSTQKNV